ncbi:hypothetical protein NLG97_g8381 [Lecanicillium saksenae]|uniref:Uncharacterized protein n=1 Tax=Lecanicillium saksenae TaxID=468837 RepID=A0ACC1QM38_9HYPO|nr:hypothetical protein NLG97_g8381 [Lecanicillium saksenae]
MKSITLILLTAATLASCAPQATQGGKDVSPSAASNAGETPTETRPAWPTDDIVGDGPPYMKRMAEPTGL